MTPLPDKLVLLAVTAVLVAVGTAVSVIPPPPWVRVVTTVLLVVAIGLYVAAVVLS